MNRPPSIVRFEQLYLASFVLGMAVSLLNWSQRMAVLTANPILATMHWILPVSFVLGAVVNLLLWYYVARRPGIVAKWIVVVFAGLTAINMLWSLYLVVSGRAPAPLLTIVSFVVGGLYVASAAMLFRLDALPWFGEPPQRDASTIDRAPII